nr:HupE/UreJ family protein [Pseudenhygromyxa sp. WMMC2535]
MVGLGADHIAHGSDHLLFILALLLAAVVRPVAGRWAGGRPTGEGLRAIAWVVSAFTIGHTLTLILGVTGVVRLPSQPVEIAIALTLVVSAAHALRPIFPRHEAWIAAGFGLIHGLAFASELADFAPDKLSLGLGLAGFNIGIELVQLLIVVAITPSLLVLARTPAYRYLRIGGASIVIVAATGWLLERVGLDLGLEAEFNTLDQVAPWVVLGLAIGLAVLAGVLGKKRRQLPATGVVATSSGSA